MRENIFDIETDGLNPTKIHCLSINTYGNIKSTTLYENMRSFFTNVDVLIGHNITRYDIPVVERLLDIKVKAKIVDTLALSWYLFPQRNRHGLADWGEEFVVPKPPIDDWENLSPEEYIHRCEEDVKINEILWNKIWKYLLKLYGSEEGAWELIDYLMFKMDCAREQERSGWLLDVEKCEVGIKELTNKFNIVFEALKNVMPDVPIMTKKVRPKHMYKKCGDLSVAGEKWRSLQREFHFGKKKQYVHVITGTKEPNPNSSDQIKDWLFDLGWKPETFDHKRDPDNYRNIRKVPQVRVTKDGVKELCPSVKILKSKSDGIESLETITVLAHRLSTLKGFMKNVNSENYIQACISGFTNTLRFKHSVLVNLPSINKDYGELLRGCLIAPKGYELCGSDMCGLEDKTKQHYMFKHDPDFVNEMNTPDYDAHLDICVLAGLLTQEESYAHKTGEKKQSIQRHKGKTANYACTYGATPPTIARQADIPIKDAETLVKTYWERNWSLVKIAEECEIKTINKQKWLLNPVSNIWYSLKNDRDRFSTLNQGTGAYCFDRWVWHMRQKRPQLTGQFHDEVILCVKNGNRDKAQELLKWSINQVNEELKLNIDLDVDVAFGGNYAEIH